MFLSDLRVALFLAYVVLIVWRGSAGMPEGVWPYMLVLTALVEGTRRLEVWIFRARLQRDIEAFSAADPERATAAIERMWSAYDRRHYRSAVAAEGQVERDGTTERFLFPRSARRRAEWLFWGSAVFALLLLGSLFVYPLPAVAGWIVWGAGFTLAGVAGLWRSKARVRSSVVEVTPWEIVLCDAAGEREAAIRWSQSLLLQNQPKQQRVLLTTARGEPRIELHYARVGFGRLLPLVLELGGFPAETDAKEQSTAPAS